MNLYRAKFSFWTILFGSGIVIIGLKFLSISLQDPTTRALNNEANDDNTSDLRAHDDKDTVKYASKMTNENKNIKTINTVNRTIWDHPPPGTQMGDLQIAAIRKVIESEGNVLVWGLGNDSPFWHDCTRGKVIFIEPAGVWYDKILGEYPYLEAYTVKYTTRIGESFDKYFNSPQLWSDLDLRSQLPTVVSDTNWNVILVDAPPGYEGAPGRFQSIYTSSLLARNGTHVFVDDYERKVEREFSHKMLGKPIEVVDRPAKGYLNHNKQAHFIHIKQ